MMRILATAILFLAILFLPLWAGVLIVALFAFAFTMYYEALLVGFIADQLYAPSATLTSVYALKYLVAFMLTVVIIEFLKAQLKFYK